MMNRFTMRAQNVLNAALSHATELGHTYIGSEHLLLGLLSETEGMAARLLSARGVGAEEVRAAVVELSGEGEPGRVSPSDMTPRTRKIIRDAAVESGRAGQSYVGTEHLLFSLLGENDCVAVRILSGLSVPMDDLRRDVVGFLAGPAASSTPGERTDARPESPGEGSRRSERRGERRGMRTGGEAAGDVHIPGAPVLSRYGRDLTGEAAAGRLDPIIGRENETERVIEILSRRQKNNPCLIGEPGVGKTAVVEGLARRMAEGQVPENLRNRILVTLDIPAMLAGAKYRGEFEERLKSVMSEVRENPAIILFIDEVHTLVGAGAAEGAVDAANILKPALARGELQVIGATTVEEYRRHIEKDAALERRFRAVVVGEPSEEETVAILTGLRPSYEAHHRLRISEEAIRAAVTLSVRYMPEHCLPDKALDLLDEAAARRRIASLTEPPNLRGMEARLSALAREKEEAIRAQEFERAARLRDEEVPAEAAYREARERWSAETDVEGKSGISPTVGAGDIAAIVTARTGIPVSRLLEGEGERLQALEAVLGERVMGQEAAIGVLSRAIRRGRLGLGNPRRPIGSFIFAGGTGVGKTALARALSEALFGSDRSLIRLDMSEYMEKHSISRLVGSPPGYVGHEEGGQLTERVRRQPYAVVLFDEVEKAHPDVFDLLLQVLDDGCLTDAQGRRVDFRNTVIILTTNLGLGQTAHKPVGFGLADAGTEARILGALRESFRPEFLGRVDEVVIFNPLREQTMRAIADRVLREIGERVGELGVKLSFAPAVIELVVQEAMAENAGARPLQRAAVRLIEDPLASALLAGRISAGEQATALVRGGRVDFVQDGE